MMNSSRFTTPSHLIQGIAALTINQMQQSESHPNAERLHQPFSVDHFSFGESLSLSPPRSSIEEVATREMRREAIHFINQHSRRRILFNKFQITQLEKCFRRQRYLSPQEREELARTTGLTPTQVGGHFI